MKCWLLKNGLGSIMLNCTLFCPIRLTVARPSPFGDSLTILNLAEHFGATSRSCKWAVVPWHSWSQNSQTSVHYLTLHHPLPVDGAAHVLSRDNTVFTPNFRELALVKALWNLTNAVANSANLSSRVPLNTKRRMMVRDSQEESLVSQGWGWTLYNMRECRAKRNELGDCASLWL